MVVLLVPAMILDLQLLQPGLPVRLMEWASNSFTGDWGSLVNVNKVYIPAGSYGMSTQVTLSGGDATGIRIDGQIYRTG